MSAKNRRHRHNQQAESRLLDNDPIEQRALQISRLEGRDVITQEDRQRAQEELLAPNETPPSPELSREVDTEITAWDEAPGSSGKRAEKVLPEDEASVGKELIEKGMRGPHRSREREVRYRQIAV
jgi:hypothetical protein